MPETLQCRTCLESRVLSVVCFAMKGFAGFVAIFMMFQPKQASISGSVPADHLVRPARKKQLSQKQHYARDAVTESNRVSANNGCTSTSVPFASWTL